ncbi:lysozyme inhibitor LprI family protein [Chromobacterium haemolyticum]|nr:lysozyme inhibitor LprI family protein [Chromobacterium haemolyticum]
MSGVGAGRRQRRLGGRSWPRGGERAAAKPPRKRWKPTRRWQPDFNCDKPGNPVEAMVCQDESLTRQDNRLEKVYAQALEQAQQGRPGAEAKLIAEQRRWVKSLKDCVKTEDMHMCLGDVYIMRITQLQAAWGLAPSLTPLRYVCKGNATRTVLATFYRTHPPPHGEAGVQRFHRHLAPGPERQRRALHGVGTGAVDQGPRGQHYLARRTFGLFQPAFALRTCSRSVALRRYGVKNKLKMLMCPSTIPLFRSFSPCLALAREIVNSL